ncbi:MAG: FHIPEP family type III secretion protein [Candidatus Eremiobacteraeota bacterium]|nr:FHIPEP family type III secretion protein [Candidatus Eremiobacteraeota bacterium]
MKDTPREDSEARTWHPPPKWLELLSLILFLSPFLFMVLYSLPPGWIDILIGSALGMSFLLFVVAFFVKDNHSFAIFPTAALILTLFRMALYIASLRAVIWKGMAGASPGVVISAFSAPEAAAGLLPGLMALALLIFIELFIIARLKDKLPLIEEYMKSFLPPGKPNPPPDFWLTEEERRQKYREVDFAGALDGTARFITFDAWLTVLLTAAALPLGFHIGRTAGFAPDAALLKIVSLCAGTGQAALYSALFVGLAWASVFTRAPYGKDEENGNNRNISIAVYALAVMLCLSGVIMLLVKGSFPWFPFFTTSGALVLMGRLYPLNPFVTLKELAGIPANLRRKKDLREPEKPLPPLSLELGKGNQAWFRRDTFMKCLEPYARELETELGSTMPPVSFSEGRFGEKEYIIAVTDGRKQTFAREFWEVLPGRLLATGRDCDLAGLEGIEACEPLYCRPALWIEESAREKAESQGCIVMDPHAVIAQHLAGLIRKSFSFLLTLKEVEARLKRLRREKYPVGDLIPRRLTREKLHSILQDLLRERLPIGDLKAVLAAIKGAASEGHDLPELTEALRAELAGQLCLKRSDSDGALKVITLASELEKKLLLASTDFAGEKKDELFQGVSMGIKLVYLEWLSAGAAPLLLVSPPVRSLVRKITAQPPADPPLFCCVNPMRLTIAAKKADPWCPDLTVISSSDVPRDVKLSVIADMNIEDPS